MGTYSFNSNSQMKFFESLKDALDPKGILMPGRYGIFPRSYRGKGWELKGGESALFTPCSKLSLISVVPTASSDPALRTI